MRPQGRAQTSRTWPRAHAVCDRCSFRYNHDQLRWQFQWTGPKLQNIRLLVCDECYDTPQEQLRTIVLPPDPVPIMNPRPENYSVTDNPVSTVGYDPIAGLGDNFGTTTNVSAAFDGATTKAYFLCGAQNVSIAGLNNYVGKNWAGSVTNPAPLSNAPLTYNVTQFAAYAPSNMAFIGSGASVAYAFQASNDNVSYTNLFSGNTVGSVGEVLSQTLTMTGYYQYHRIIFTGDGINKFGIAQLQMVGTPQSVGAA